MLIDTSYFYGPLTIPQLELEVATLFPVKINVEAFINDYEPKLLRSLLGYELYVAFMAGLQEVVIAQKWIDLLYGKEYTGWNDRLTKWDGLVAYIDSITISATLPDDRTYEVGGAGDYDPVEGVDEINDPFLVDKKYRLIERQTGPLKQNAEWQTTATGLKLLSHTFETGGVYTVQFVPFLIPIPSSIIPQVAKKSPIANWVYYWFSRNESSKTTGSGEKVLDAQNASPWPSKQKQCWAWNDMVMMNRECFEFLRFNPDTYPEFVTDHWNNSIFRTINTMNI